jgi:hypothetical protein
MLRSRYIQFPVVRDSANSSASLFALSNAKFSALLSTVALKLPQLAMSATTFTKLDATSVSSALTEKDQLKHVIKIGNVIFFICISTHQRLIKNFLKKRRY